MWSSTTLKEEVQATKMGEEEKWPEIVDSLRQTKGLVGFMEHKIKPGR